MKKTVTGELSQHGTGCVAASVTWEDSVSGLTVRCESTHFAGANFPVVEWVVYLKNNGQTPSPLIENIRTLDCVWPYAPSAPVTIYHGRGSNANDSDFAPLEDTLEPGGQLSLGSHGRAGNRVGVPSVEALPFFNVAAAAGGVIAGIGWPGPWTAACTRNEQGTVSIQAGLEPMRFRLQPGEEVRTPRMVLFFWEGDRLRAHNGWRAFLRAHFSPMPDEKPFAGLIADGNWGSWMPAERHIQELRWWREHDLPVDCYWIDAGWTNMSLGWEAHQSTQEPDAALFPEGMKPISDAAHALGMKFLLWMVPPSVHPAVGIGKEHPEWLGESYGDPALGSMVFHCLDHGDPAVNRYMMDHFSKVVEDFGVDIFRQDGGNLWPADTDPDRMGLHQLHYIQGACDFWDGLLERHPGLLIDNCAEGGRKIDLESIRRSMVLWRSDSQASGEFDPISNQTFTYGLAAWIPLFGGVVPVHHLSAYAFRSAYAPALLLGWPMKPVTDIGERWKDINIELLWKLLNEYIALRPNLFGDFYPLTPYSRDTHEWMAWQCDRPDLGHGMVQAFRRPDCAEETQIYRLNGLAPDATYSIVNIDGDQPCELSGNVLLEEGIAVNIPGKPGAAIVSYELKNRP